MSRQSANVLRQNLPAASRPVFAERAAMELIVILDWSSTAIIPAKTISLIKTILLKVNALCVCQFCYKYNTGIDPYTNLMRSVKTLKSWFVNVTKPWFRLKLQIEIPLLGC